MASIDIQQALTLHRAGNIDAAMKLYRRLLSKNPNDYGALHYLGVAQATLGNKEEAERLLSRSLRATPKNPEFFANYGHLLFTMDRHAAALEAFDEVVRLVPGNAAIFNMRGVILAELKRFAGRGVELRQRAARRSEIRRGAL